MTIYDDDMSQICLTYIFIYYDFGVNVTNTQKLYSSIRSCFK